MEGSPPCDLGGPEPEPGEDPATAGRESQEELPDSARGWPTRDQHWVALHRVRHEMGGRSAWHELQELVLLEKGSVSVGSASMGILRWRQQSIQPGAGPF